MLGNRHAESLDPAPRSVRPGRVCSHDRWRSWREQVDPVLQGRLVQRSDGALYVVKDGFKYAVNVADVGDDDINVLPDAPGVDRVDQLFAQPAAAAVSSPATPEPAANPALTAPGTLLYQADWSTGPNGWALPA